MARVAPHVTAIPLGRSSRIASSNQPGRRPGNRLEPCGSGRPYSVLLPAGLAMPRPLPAARCALTAPFHPYRSASKLVRQAVRSLWRYPWGRPRRTLSGAVFPWSPDFPPADLRRASGRPADWLASDRGWRATGQRGNRVRKVLLSLTGGQMPPLRLRNDESPRLWFDVSHVRLRTC